MEEPASSGDPLSIIINLIFLIFLLFLSGVFSGSETALMSVSKLKLRKYAEDEKDDSRKEMINKYIEQPNKMLTAILVMNNLVNILASAEATLLALKLLPETSEGVAAAVVTGIMTFLILVFGEITPKIYARENTEKVFNSVIGLISFITIVLKPVIWLLVSLSNFFIVIIGGKSMRETPFITEDEIISAVDVGHKEGVLQDQERQMMKRSLELKDISVREIMTPRVEMVCMEENESLMDLMKVVEDEGYSRIPVYRENIDRIVGVCYAKDLFRYIIDTNDEKETLEKTPVKEMMRQPYFVPETKKVDDLMKEFKEQKIHLAIVVDEYGGTAGLVTMEDILEELTGEILDEYDIEAEEITIKKVGDNVYIVDAMTPINDLERELDVKFPETEYETIGGYLLEILERFPEIGERIVVGDFIFEILAAGKKKIEKIRLIVDRGKKNVAERPGEKTDRNGNKG
ncbi:MULTISPECIES: hemolysin family protein [Kosmotoga]|uniref:CBS domain containing protein n=1 Tax=Kosmotoga olearia (strain ATCC BAA-1733 / DSM 21960 / TBF 19.5.1) TaxID=521045 RepID=C5CFQ5_KOSOT|nr:MULTISPECIES: hemolysin family protein [Kosmotoga]ACR80403.1 protein of unknown function DUF21 [Kosmotoga olearia TBF 19.5.1]MDI3523375.1 magnesium and cobalt exporter, family [Kosmotoga sp.]MDK2952873.1 magnesium and cobalt exporter, family [Kosmotoga sp.]OAA19904.1 hemolysin [Kosmotoga sp. DU53]